PKVCPNRHGDPAVTCLTPNRPPTAAFDAELSSSRGTTAQFECGVKVMKFLIAAASVSVIAISAPAFAQMQPTANTGVYANLGYSNFGIGDADISAIQGRLGYRFNDYVGVEGEVAGGLAKDKVGVAPGVDAKVKLDHQEAIY